MLPWQSVVVWPPSLDNVTLGDECALLVTLMESEGLTSTVAVCLLPVRCMSSREGECFEQCLILL